MADVEGLSLEYSVALLGAAVVAVPVFTRLGLGAVLGYLAAGLLVGPFALAFVTNPVTLLHVAEIGVVLFLFIIGLEMRPSRLWTLRKAIFGLGAAQVALCGFLLTLLGLAAGFSPVVAFIGAMGFVLSSTAIIMRMMEERGMMATQAGQRGIAILLFEDLAIVPLLAIVALLGSLGGAETESARPVWLALLIAAGAIALTIAAGRWLLDPFFKILARTGAREVMTAAALLVVLGTAIFMDWAGLSMAMGAFLAGVLLSESTFRHQLEADIEPFRGILLGLFFMSVGMALDLSLVAAQWRFLVLGVLAAMAVKAIAIWVIAKSSCTDRRERILRAALFAQGGEFAFVLYSAALGAGLFDPATGALMTALVILSMALTPLVMLVVERLLPEEAPDPAGLDTPDGLEGRVLSVGFGRFAQVVSQALLARGVDISVIETDVELIQVAATFGFKVYYGDGTRLDVLHASGAHRAEAILICTDKPETTDRIVELCKAQFPLARLYARAFDRGHAMRLIQAGVEYQLREVFESSLTFSRKVLLDLGFDEETAEDAIADVRRRDGERLELQLVGGITAGRWLLRGNMQTPQPEPFVRPAREGEVLSPAAAPQAGPPAPKPRRRPRRPAGSKDAAP
jgi:glutathione-regulated potassium-efflux system protein KefB